MSLPVETLGPRSRWPPCCIPPVSAPGFSHGQFTCYTCANRRFCSPHTAPCFHSCFHIGLFLALRTHIPRMLLCRCLFMRLKARLVLCIHYFIRPCCLTLSLDSEFWLGVRSQKVPNVHERRVAPAGHTASYLHCKTVNVCGIMQCTAGTAASVRKNTDVQLRECSTKRKGCLTAI